MFRPSVPITLLVLAEVLGKHGSGPVFLCHGKRGMRSAWCSVRQLAGGGLFRRIAEEFSVIWMSSVAMTALSQMRSASISFVSVSCMQERSSPGHINSAKCGREIEVLELPAIE